MWMAGIFGALCWMTRPAGIVLLPTLAIEAAHQFWKRNAGDGNGFGSHSFRPGFGVYLLLNLKIAGNAFAFLPMRKELFHLSDAWPWIGMQEAYRNRLQAPSRGDHGRHAGIVLRLFRVICAIVSWIKLRPIYAVWITGSWLLVTSATFLVSEPRYALTLFPIFMLALGTESILLWNHNDGIASFSRPFRRAFRPRLVGFLISDSVLQATVEQDCFGLEI